MHVLLLELSNVMFMKNPLSHFFFFFNLRHRVKNTRVEAEAYNQLTNPFQV